MTGKEPTECIFGIGIHHRDIPGTVGAGIGDLYMDDGLIIPERAESGRVVDYVEGGVGSLPTQHLDNFGSLSIPIGIEVCIGGCLLNEYFGLRPFCDQFHVGILNILQQAGPLKDAEGIGIIDRNRAAGFRYDRLLFAEEVL